MQNNENTLQEENNFEEKDLKRRKCLWWWPIRFTKYYIVKNHEDWELIIESGIFGKSQSKMKIFKISDISYERSFGNWFFGVGNLKLYSSDNSSRVTEICKIRKYKQFGKIIEELAFEERKRVNVKYTETNIIK